MKFKGPLAFGQGLWLAPLAGKSVWDQPVHKARNDYNNNNNNNNNNSNFNDSYNTYIVNNGNRSEWSQETT